jgi:hypothetical protein
MAAKVRFADIQYGGQKIADAPIPVPVAQRQRLSSRPRPSTPTREEARRSTLQGPRS